MTAIRNFPDAPQRHEAGAPLQQRFRAWTSSQWQALQRIGQKRAAWHLYALAGQHARTSPKLASEFGAAADECLKQSNQPNQPHQ